MRYFFAILASQEFAGTTLTEIRERWSIRDVFDALDFIAWRQAVQWVNRPKQGD